MREAAEWADELARRRSAASSPMRLAADAARSDHPSPSCRRRGSPRARLPSYGRRVHSVGRRPCQPRLRADDLDRAGCASSVIRVGQMLIGAHAGACGAPAERRSGQGTGVASSGRRRGATSPDLGSQRIPRPDAAHVEPPLHVRPSGRSRTRSRTAEPRQALRVPVSRGGARRGSRRLSTAPPRLQEAFTFPADDLRQQHVGFLLALLQTRGGLEKRMTRRGRGGAARAFRSRWIPMSSETGSSRWSTATRRRDARRRRPR